MGLDAPEHTHYQTPPERTYKTRHTSHMCIRFVDTHTHTHYAKHCVRAWCVDNYV